MIETNFDNCVGPLHCVSLLKDVTRELKVHRGTTQLEQFIIIFAALFTVNVCLMIILFI